MSDLVRQLQAARAARPNPTTAGSIEINRIVGLPVVHSLTPEELEAFCRQEIVGKHYESGFRFFECQARAVLAYDIHGGAFCPIGVGWGKTLISLMIAARAFREGIERSLLVIPPQVYAQLTKRDIPWARQRVDLNVPFQYMGGRSQAERRAIASSKRRGCYVLPYSCLSTRDSSEILNLISPQLVILDEAHAIKNRQAARTKRLLDFLERTQPKVVVLSGTMTSKSIRDYHHLISWALGEGSPLPLAGPIAEQWALVLDAEADPGDAQTGPIQPLVRWAEREFPKEKLPPHVAGFRKAYKLRLTSTPGVVATGDNEISTSLLIENLPVKDHKEHAGWDALKKLMEDVTDRWLTPSGDEIDYAIHQWRYLFELNSGFFYRLVWPSVEEIKQRRAMTDEEAADFLARAQEHHRAQQNYHRELREWLKRHFIAGLDTPMLVGAEMAAHGAKRVGHDLYEYWQKMKELELPGMPERDSIPVRICDFKVAHAVHWAHQMRTESEAGAIIWYWHRDFGEWLTEALRAANLDPLHCPAGEPANVAITDPANSKRLVVASMIAHGTGKNLQAFQHQLFAQFPRDAAQAEQVVGRTHRNGQTADELIVHTANTTEFDHQNMAACLNDALYLHQTMGARQKLIYASYNPLPRIYPGDFLRERGFQPKKLTAEEQRLLSEKFGGAEAEKG